MRSNKSIITKADLAIGDLISDGGYLQPEQADRFIRKAMLSANLLGRVRVVTMNSPQRNINKIFFNKRIMRKATSGVALANAAVDADTPFNPADANEGLARAKPKTEQIQLTTKELIAQVDLPYDVIEDVIERGVPGVRTDTGGEPLAAPFKETILTLMAQAAARDLQELALQGDTTLDATDPYLDVNDGYIKIGETLGNVYSAAGATIGLDVFKEALKMLPEQYRDDKARMRWLVSSNQEIEYRYKQSTRATAIGDAVITSMPPVYGLGVELNSITFVPDAKIMLTMPLNLIWGIQRQIQLEYEKDIERRVFKIVLTLRCDFKIEEPAAVVVVTNVGTP